jgi:hypothetical protein
MALAIAYLQHACDNFAPGHDNWITVVDHYGTLETRVLLLHTIEHLAAEADAEIDVNELRQFRLVRLSETARERILEGFVESDIHLGLSQGRLLEEQQRFSQVTHPVQQPRPAATQRSSVEEQLREEQQRFSQVTHPVQQPRPAATQRSSVLAVVRAHPGLTSTQIAHALERETDNVAATLSQLMREGLIRRQETIDRRKRVYIYFSVDAPVEDVPRPSLLERLKTNPFEDP